MTTQLRTHEAERAQLGIALDDVMVHVSPSCKDASSANTIARKSHTVHEQLSGSRYALGVVRRLRRV